MTLPLVDDRAISYIQAICAVVTALNILVVALIWHHNTLHDQAVGNVGRTAVDENKMGPFAVRWQKGKEARPPILFTISTIIKAGDAHVFTSSLFDGLSSSHEHVSWRCLYEAFLKEMAWRECPASEASGRIWWKSLYNNAVEESVWQQLRSSWELVRNSMRWGPWLTVGLEWLEAGYLMIHSKVWTVPKSKEHWKPIEHARSWSRREVRRKLRINSVRSHKNLDRHFLYPEFKKLFRVQDTERRMNNGGSFLECCIRMPGLEDPWDMPPDFHPLLGHEYSWRQHLQQIWIFEERPCVEVSKTELAAIALAMGIRLCLNYEQPATSSLPTFKLKAVELSERGNAVLGLKYISSSNAIKATQEDASTEEHPRSLEGDGIFGRRLVGQPSVGNSWNLRLVVGKMEHDSDGPSRGSGYSTLFAKCLACGCIPFDLKDLWNRVIFVTKGVLEGIQSGQDILDGFAHDERDKDASSKPMDYLERLPAANRISFYMLPGKPVKDQVPDVCRDPSAPLKSWTEVVAGIAFGGLVPMAALNLVRAVRFTAQGGRDPSTPPLNVLQNLWDIVIRIQCSTQNHQLFGQHVEDCSKSKEGSEIEKMADPAEASMVRATAAIGHLSTMLEYVVARSSTFKVDQDGGVDITPATTHKLIQQKRNGVRTDAFIACCRELSKSYLRSRSRFEAQNRAWTRSREEQDDDASESKDLLNAPFDVDTCGKISRYIILAWTYYVTIVVWNEEEEQEALQFVGGRNRDRIYRPVDLDKLPRSYFLE